MKYKQKELLRHFNQVMSLEANSFKNGRIDKFYYSIIDQLNNMPFKVIIPISIIFAVILYLIFRTKFVLLTSLLQYGF